MAVMANMAACMVKNTPVQKVFSPRSQPASDSGPGGGPGCGVLTAAPPQPGAPALHACLCNHGLKVVHRRCAVLERLPVWGTP